MSESTLSSHKTYTVSRPLRSFVVAICALSLLTLIYKGYQHHQYKNHFYDNSKQELLILTKRAALDIENILLSGMLAADNLSNGISSGEISAKDFHSTLKAVIRDNKLFYGGSITFRPYGFSAKKELHSEYYYKRHGETEPIYLSLDKDVDYTDEEKYDWFAVPMREGSRWGEPYWDEAGQTYMVTYSSVFYEPQNPDAKIPLGVVTIDISMTQLKEIIENLKIGSSGFSALVTQDGNYLYHPNSEYVKKHLSLEDVSKLENDPDRLLLIEKVENQESGIMDHLSTTSGKNSWLIYSPVEISGWSLHNTFILSDLSINKDLLRQQIIILLTIAIAFLISFGFLFITNLSPKAVTFFTAFGTLVLLLSTATLWNIALAFTASDLVGDIALTDKRTLEAIVQKTRQQREDKNLELPLEIPTGIYLDSLDFSSSNTVSVSGRIWQKYPKDLPPSFKKGVYFKRALDVEFTEPHIQLTEKYENWLWHFEAEIKEKIDYSRYPLEVEHLGIELLPVDNINNTVLLPDFSSYSILTPTLLPGINKEVFIPGWVITDSFFSFKYPKNYTSFGVDSNFDENVLPHLNYEIGIKRVVVDAFVSNLMPLVVVSCILFLSAFLPSRVDMSHVLTICATLFFAVVFSHMAIRRNIAIGEIFYLEYFFFVIYIALLLTPANNFRLYLNVSVPIMEYKNGLILKAAYWPVILSIFYIITALKFY